MKKAANVTRPEQSMWGVLVLVIGSMGGFNWLAWTAIRTHSKLNHDDHIMLWLVGSLTVILLGAMVPAAIDLFNRVTWEESGIRYRTIRGEQFFHWSDITDYGFRVATQRRSKKYQHYVVCLRDGTQIRFSGDWENNEAFRSVVTSHANNARARTWEHIGTRLIDSPSRTFRYSTKGSTIGVVITGLVAVAMTALLIFGFREKFREAFTLMGMGWGIALVLMMASFTLATPVLAAYSTMRTRREVAKHAHESITVTGETIAFSDGKRVREFPWTSVLDCYVDNAPTSNIYVPYAIQLAGGNEETIRFHGGIEQVETLKAIITQHALALTEKPWRHVGKDADIAPKSVGTWWGSDSQARTYTYRNATTRLFLFLGTAFLGMVPLTSLLRGIVLQEPIVFGATQWIISGVFGIALSYIWWRYLSARVVIDDEGIVQYAPFTIRRLRWLDVTNWSVPVSKESGLPQAVVLHGADKRRVEATLFINGFDDLKQEIERRTGMPPRTPDKQEK